MDLRTTSGSFFLFIGGLLIILGIAAPFRAPLTTSNLNLYSGLSMVVFGGVLLWIAKRKS